MDHNLLLKNLNLEREKRIMTTGRVFTVPRMQGLPENGLLISDGYGYESVFEEWPFYESDFVIGDETR